MAKPKKQKFPHLLGSKWTAQQRTMGWRHFQVTNRKNEGKLVFAELVASCDPTIRFWINANVLKNRQLWKAGWKTLDQISGEQSQNDGIS
ncbi:TIGR02450 family Trp-rich protein [Leptolyngbya cf. ectocarpi LEGE 11479]|uniref:TIGR02450 family Trp-rich protein n=1 Tax=Leptolyngbya cf. ectocarpi LEGE 11479 TaxID=1828722 RepID=A0A928WZG0_LEPEC|nr:TIGR02450 family Trp-rich protein [Leptolyngbya ectocarpi]MBE9065120.1 TIGR02450 family Trp-rich protein [Leptolyngbya cf. ectocarpi LEGE 11479]